MYVNSSKSNQSHLIISNQLDWSFGWVKLDLWTFITSAKSQICFSGFPCPGRRGNPRLMWSNMKPVCYVSAVSANARQKFPSDQSNTYTSALQSKNAVSSFYITRRVLSFSLGKFLKWLANDQSSSITKGSIYYIKHVYIQPFSMEVDWPEIWCLMEVSAMFYICRYCILLCGADIYQLTAISNLSLVCIC